MIKRIGFIGLGIMGKPMSLNLLNAGFSVTVYDVDRSRLDELAAAGAKRAVSSEEVAASSDIVIIMVTDTTDVLEVIVGNKSVIEGAAVGTVVIDMSTISPKVTRALALRLEEKGVRMLDAPVSGGEPGAQAGTLSIMVGGDKGVFEECLPIFEVLGDKVTYMGSNGSGQSVKLFNQVVFAMNNLALAEGLLFASKAGVDLDVALEAVTAGAAGSWVVSSLGPRVLRKDFEPGFMVRLMEKDLRLIMEAAQEMGLSLPGTSLTHQLFKSLLSNDEGDKGTQALVKVLERMAGHELE